MPHKPSHNPPGQQLDNPGRQGQDDDAEPQSGAQAATDDGGQDDTAEPALQPVTGDDADETADDTAQQAHLQPASGPATDDGRPDGGTDENGGNDDENGGNDDENGGDDADDGTGAAGGSAIEASFDADGDDDGGDDSDHGRDDDDDDGDDDDNDGDDGRGGDDVNGPPSSSDDGDRGSGQTIAEAPEQNIVQAPEQNNVQTIDQTIDQNIIQNIDTIIRQNLNQNRGDDDSDAGDDDDDDDDDGDARADDGAPIDVDVHQEVEVSQKVVVVQQNAHPTAPTQVININVDLDVNVDNDVKVIQGGPHQTVVSGTQTSDILFTTVSNATLTGGDGDDILVAGATNVYIADIEPLNVSGVSGTAILVQDEDTLTVRVVAAGLEPGQPHIQDIHGRFAGDDISDAADAGTTVGEDRADEPTPIDSIIPPADADADGDGFIEFEEGLPYYGPGILSLASPQGAFATGFPVPEPDGTITFMQAYDLRATLDFEFTRDDLVPLELREVVLHGLSNDGDGEDTPGEIDGTAGYKPDLPVAAGEIELIQATARVESPGTLNATMNGDAGDDILLGKGGNDILRGGDGDDWLAGSGGRNRLDGGDGADVFVLGEGRDVIEDFDFDEGDRLLVPGDQTDLNAVVTSAESVATGARIETDDGEVTLVGIAAADINTDWFVVA
ncbi:MAG TPA: hypothetical protein VF342_00305 [Alphaproteobacteria bacterium]